MMKLLLLVLLLVCCCQPNNMKVDAFSSSTPQHSSSNNPHNHKNHNQNRDEFFFFPNENCGSTKELCPPPQPQRQRQQQTPPPQEFFTRPAQGNRFPVWYSPPQARPPLHPPSLRTVETQQAMVDENEPDDPSLTVRTTTTTTKSHQDTLLSAMVLGAATGVWMMTPLLYLTCPDGSCVPPMLLVAALEASLFAGLWVRVQQTSYTCSSTSQASSRSSSTLMTILAILIRIGIDLTLRNDEASSYLGNHDTLLLSVVQACVLFGSTSAVLSSAWEQELLFLGANDDEKHDNRGRRRRPPPFQNRRRENFQRGTEW